ncbi:MAG: integration host factor subunit beta [Candidatus Marinimicrobia bacterium]|nr:integration host factor subunit beta [Candidatus Neomarinimicrobiota bacterium]
MRKSDIVKEISTATGLTQVETEAVIEGFISVVSEALVQGERVDLRGFGNFILKIRKAKAARNISTGETVHVPEHYLPYFKASESLKERVNANLKKVL